MGETYILGEIHMDNYIYKVDIHTRVIHKRIDTYTNIHKYKGNILPRGTYTRWGYIYKEHTYIYGKTHTQTDIHTEHGRRYIWGRYIYGGDIHTGKTYAQRDIYTERYIHGRSYTKDLVEN